MATSLVCCMQFVYIITSLWDCYCFKSLAMLLGVQWYLIMLLICICLRAGDAEHVCVFLCAYCHLCSCFGSCLLPALKYFSPSLLSSLLFLSSWLKKICVMFVSVCTGGWGPEEDVRSPENEVTQGLREMNPGNCGRTANPLATEPSFPSLFRSFKRTSQLLLGCGLKPSVAPCYH